MSATRTKQLDSTVAELWLLQGPVQGIGLRPAIARWALQCRLNGHVRNTTAGVELRLEGSPEDLRSFAAEFLAKIPRSALAAEIEREPTRVLGHEGFAILDSSATSALTVRAPVDLAICAACLDDFHAVDNRRHNYPLITCAECGPRFSLLESMPYDRHATTMRHFPLCASCQREYASPADRRFHAESIACPGCGPRIWFVSKSKAAIHDTLCAISAAAAAIIDGKIVAIRGVGGYQLLVDANDEAAVARLRVRKSRPAKPLAIMVASLSEAQRLAHTSAPEVDALVSPANPIVVLAAKAANGLAPSVAGRLNTVGIMLPTTALHAMLLRAVGRPLIATSANREGEPLVFDPQQAESELSEIADAWLHHDRPILSPVDDSVVRVIAGRLVTLRLGRGMAPLPLPLPPAASAIALGGQQKVAVALCNGRQSTLGPHVGDLGSLAMRGRFQGHVESLSRIYDLDQAIILHDAHPDYFTTAWAEERGAARLAVQHHHAHVVSGMIEHGWLSREVLGVALDGAGYGPDGTIWGGEFLRATALQFERVGRLLPFALTGGEMAVREPWRMAVSLVQGAMGAEHARRLQFADVRPDEVAALARLAENDRLSIPTSSAGRLFDGAAALAFGISRVDFEGQAAMLLESACDISDTGAYPFCVSSQTPFDVDWRPAIRALLNDRQAGVSPAIMAMRFHRGVAEMIAQVCERFADLPIVLAGGVFQNRILVELLQERFRASTQPLGLPGRIPPNDGGLAAGQLAVFLARVRAEEGRQCV